MDQVLYPQHAAGVCFATVFQSLYDWAVIHKGKIPGKWICMNKIGLLIRKSMVNISGGRFSGEGGNKVQQHSEKKAGLKWRIVQFLGVSWLHAFSMDLHAFSMEIYYQPKVQHMCDCQHAMVVPTQDEIFEQLHSSCSLLHKIAGLFWVTARGSAALRLPSRCQHCYCLPVVKSMAI